MEILECINTNRGKYLDISFNLGQNQATYLISILAFNCLFGIT